MSTPFIRPQTTAELIAEREQIIKDIYPFTIEMLDQIRYTEAISEEQLKALETYEVLNSVIGDR